ncbi:SWIB-domain-containing protein [Hyphopichia burtonii NRRL Y-1933]|uniref:SWIB-domain-containing protein n=1 Tax=Hyphopichia burtonii NRRL Y-1933 TaxID=984485 RepID=A0A1E4RR25_9ASCO|nr:SWIB-domain-containing protein [Hyphopichia burtonii NRRL Y-1933]ODV69729.1 SWIB-domain-containing protein [Hyphopichia burtonii NRRL Y-1933]
MTEEYNPKQYLPTIDAILSVADLEKITVKKIRNALQELFGINLQPHKQDISDIIMERYFDLLEKRKNKVEPPPLSKEDIERQDALMASQLLKSTIRGPVTRGSGKATPRKPRAKKNAAGEKKRKAPNNGFNQALYLSQDLQNLFGVESLPRPQIVKQMWTYIKDNNLQNPNDRRQILCNDTLYKIFKKKTVGIFEMNKLLTSHIFKPDEIGDTKSVGELQAKPPPPPSSKPNGKKSADYVDEEDDDDDDDQELGDPDEDDSEESDEDAD